MIGTDFGMNRYYAEPSSHLSKQMKFKLNEGEVKTILDNLIKIDKKTPLQFNNIRKDYDVMKQELIQSVMPFRLPTEAEFIKLKQELEILKKKMQVARQPTTAISSEEDQRNRQAYKQKKAQLTALEDSFQKLLIISNRLLASNELENITEWIENHTENYSNSNFDAIWCVQKDLNGWLEGSKQIILEAFPLELGEELDSMFAKLEKDEIENFQLLHAEHIVNLKRAEINAIMHPDNESMHKQMQKAYLLYQIETSQLQFAISKAIAKSTEKYHEQIIQSALEPILKEFSQGESLGAYQFKYPGSVAEEMKNLLASKQSLLFEREANEMELTFYTEQFLAYKELVSNLSQYDILTREEGQQHESMKNFYEEKMNRAIERQKKLNVELATIISKFINDNSVNDNGEVLQGIKKTLGTAANQEIGYIIAQAEKKTELGWLQWMSTQTFASRCKRGMAGLVAAGGVGGLGGGITGVGILTPVTAALGMAGGGLLGGALGFMSPDIVEQTKDKVSELQKMTADFIWGEANKVSAEYFKDPIQISGLNPKYEPTDRMRLKWGHQGAEVIAYAYVNLLFDLHVKLLYADIDNKNELEQMYQHFYRNYQMLRGDENEIKRLYKNDQWGQERVEIQVNAAKKLNLEEQLKQDLATMMLMVDKEDKDCINSVRNAINNVTHSLETLTEDKGSLLQLQESPEVKLLPSTITTKIFDSSPLMIESSRKKESKHDVKEKEKETLEEHEVQPSSQAMMVIDEEALERQKRMTQLKENAIIIANVEEEKKRIKSKFNHINALAKIAVSGKNTVEQLENIHPGFLAANTTLRANMNATHAADCLKTRDYEKFKFWYENLFLVKYKSKDNIDRKDAISRKLLNTDGLIQYDGKSLWHLLAEDSISGNELFLFMMQKQAETNFVPFSSYFDFDYVDEKGMNAIVYAGLLSNRKNNTLLTSYLNELIRFYPADPTIQKQINKTCEDIIKLKMPGDITFKPICHSFAQEIKKLWEKKEAEKAKNRNVGVRIISYAASTLTATASIDEHKLFSAILSTMALHCAEGNSIPKTEEAFIAFLKRLSNSGYLDESTKNLILDIDVKKRMSESVVEYVEQQTSLLKFAHHQDNEKINAIALDISTSTPLPLKEEQELLIAILSEGTERNIAHFKQVAANQSSLIKGLISENKKFNGKNLLWLAIEADRADVVSQLYGLSRRQFMDEAGPEGSAFTFAAKQTNKDCFTAICQGITNTTFSSAGLTRLEADKEKRIAAHYLFENGTWNVIQDYMNTETRYTSPNYKRLTGGPDKNLKTEPKFYFDDEGNTPLHLLAQRPDAASIFAKLNAFATHKNVSILDLLDVTSLNLQNSDELTPMSLICSTDNLKEAFFGTLLSKQMIEKQYNNPAYQQNLITCLELAVMNEEWDLVNEMNKVIKDLHDLNQPSWISYSSNPVENLTAVMLDNILEKYRNKTTPSAQWLKILENMNAWCLLVPPVKMIELINKLEGDEITAKNYFLMKNLLVNAVERKIVTDEKAKQYLEKFEGKVEIELPIKMDVASETVSKKKRRFTPGYDVGGEVEQAENKQKLEQKENKQEARQKEKHQDAKTDVSLKKNRT